MLYRVKSARILDDGNVVEGKRTQYFQTPQQLTVGGLYFLRPGKLYQVVEQILD